MSSPANQRIERHGQGNLQPKLGYDPASATRARIREKMFNDNFGSAPRVYHETVPVLPHIDVLQYPPGHNDRDFWTLVTSGMSDRRMTFPKGFTPECPRAELIFYCAEPRPEYLELLRILAHFPHDNASSFLPGDTMPNGNPPGPLFGNGPLDTILFAPTVTSPDDTISRKLRIESDPVDLLWVIPITSPECRLKLEKGFDALLDIFLEKQLPVVFTGNRGSFI